MRLLRHWELNEGRGSMAFTANSKIINDILSGNYQYVIPKNQRKYVWDTREWDELFEDLFEIEQKQGYNHFLGAFVFSSIKNSTDKFSIIDGQQRLTTLSLLFCAIIDKLFEIKEDKIANSFRATYLIGSKDGEEFNKVERDNESFFLPTLVNFLSKYRSREDIQKEYSISYKEKDSYNKKLLQCFFHLQNSINTLIKERKRNIKELLLSLKEKIKDTQVFEIKVDDDIDGFRIFETLNARGIPLEQHELIKNFIYNYMRTKSKQMKVTTVWDKIVDNLTTEKTEYLSPFIRHYCSHCFGKTKKDQEFRTIRDNTPHSQVEELLNSLSICSTNYKYILNPETIKGTIFCSEKIFTSLNFFSKLNIIQVRPLILSIFETTKEDENIKKIENALEILECFYFIYTIVNKSTNNNIDKTITELSVEIHNSKNIDLSKLQKSLSNFILDKVACCTNFTRLGYSNRIKEFKNSARKRAVDYVFSKIEKYLDKSNNFYIKIPSLEHIMPDSSNDIYACYIGNLLPLPIKLNNKCKDKNLDKKVMLYKQSKFIVVDEFLSHNSSKASWQKEDIIKRGELLAEKYFIPIWWNKIKSTDFI